jgi:hypothetical protein
MPWKITQLSADFSQNRAGVVFWTTAKPSSRMRSKF